MGLTGRFVIAWVTVALFLVFGYSWLADLSSILRWPGSLSGFSLAFCGAHSGSSSKQTILPNYSASPSAPSFSHFQS